jgi:hypothetical protein
MQAAQLGHGFSRTAGSRNGHAAGAIGVHACGFVVLKLPCAVAGCVVGSTILQMQVDRCRAIQVVQGIRLRHQL